MALVKPCLFVLPIKIPKVIWSILVKICTSLLGYCLLIFYLHSGCFLFTTLNHLARKYIRTSLSTQPARKKGLGMRFFAIDLIWHILQWNWLSSIFNSSAFDKETKSQLIQFRSLLSYVLSIFAAPQSQESSHISDILQPL